jgi:competence protein ComEA
VEPSTPPWRVLDTPSGQSGAQNVADEARPIAGGLAVSPLALAGVGAAVLIGAVAVVIAMSGPVGVASGPDTNASARSSASTEAGTLIVIDVTGAVVTPGVYRLGPGARVGDAIDAAGGFGPRVDAARAAAELNLAATLTDGQQLRIPSRDDPADGAAPASSGGSSGAGGAAGKMIDLNAATQAELESLPGIGPVTATKIIEARAEARFRTVDELRERGLVGQKTFDSIRALITVG